MVPIIFRSITIISPGLQRLGQMRKTGLVFNGFFVNLEQEGGPFKDFGLWWSGQTGNRPSLPGDQIKSKL